MGRGLIAREEFDRLTMEHEVAKQEVAEAEWRLSRTVIRAPFSGIVTERFINPGQHLRPGDEVFSVADFDPLIARIYLPEKDVLTLEEGRQVGLVLAADDTVRFTGKIRQISPVVDTATGTVKVTVESISPPPQVRPGAFVSVEIVRQRRDDAVLLPRRSVIREMRTAHVFVTDGDTAEKRPVTLGLEEGEIVEALSGVDAGETVIVAGQGGLKPGAKIKVLCNATSVGRTGSDAVGFADASLRSSGVGKDLGSLAGRKIAIPTASVPGQGQLRVPSHESPGPIAGGTDAFG